MDKREIVERLEKLEKKNERMEEKYNEVKEENQGLRKIIEQKTGTNKDGNSNQNVSRRDFLKKLGAGAIGLGALGLAPAASQLKISKNGIIGSSGLNFLSSGNEYFKLNQGGPVEVKNADLVRKFDASVKNSYKTPIKARDLDTTRNMMPTYHRTDVGTSSTEIAKSGVRDATLAIVVGHDGSANRFSEIIHFTRFSGSPIKISSQTAGSPASRTYDSGGYDQSLYLSMGSGTYNVTTTTIDAIGGAV